MKWSNVANIAYTAYSVHPNFGYAKTSYMLGMLYEIDYVHQISLKGG